MSFRQLPCGADLHGAGQRPRVADLDGDTRPALHQRRGGGAADEPQEQAVGALAMARVLAVLAAEHAGGERRPARAEEFGRRQACLGHARRGVEVAGAVYAAVVNALLPPLRLPAAGDRDRVFPQLDLELARAVAELEAGARGRSVIDVLAAAAKRLLAIGRRVILKVPT